MNRCPTNEEILALLERLDAVVADDLETEFLEFKPWLPDVKDNMTAALEYTVCFANHASGGVVVFGVKDRTRGRKEAYTRIKGIDPLRYREMIREYVNQHGSITNKECRALLQLGESDSAVTQASRHLKALSCPNGFLVAEEKGRARHYVARKIGES